MAISARVWRCTSNNTCASVAFSVRMDSIPFTKETVTGGFGSAGASRSAGCGGGILETAALATLVIATFVATASEAFWSLGPAAADRLGTLAAAAVTGLSFTTIAFCVVEIWVVEI